MRLKAIAAQLDVQGWECAMGSCKLGQEIKPGDALGVAYDGVGLTHLACSSPGDAPEREGAEA